MVAEPQACNVMSPVEVEEMKAREGESRKPRPVLCLTKCLIRMLTTSVGLFVPRTEFWVFTGSVLRFGLVPED